MFKIYLRCTPGANLVSLAASYCVKNDISDHVGDHCVCECKSRSTFVHLLAEKVIYSYVCYVCFYTGTILSMMSHESTIHIIFFNASIHMVGILSCILIYISGFKAHPEQLLFSEYGVAVWSWNDMNDKSMIIVIEVKHLNHKKFFDMFFELFCSDCIATRIHHRIDWHN